MAEYATLFIDKYNEMIFACAVFLRGFGMTWLTVNMLNVVVLLIVLAAVYKVYKLAEHAVIYLVVLAIITLPFIFMIISSFFYKGKNIDQLMY